MARTWTEAQKKAIDAKGQNLLLAAAAGSGKTAVLVERIIRKITDKENPVDVDKLLVLTFTNAAASEMRERINDALALSLAENPDDENLSRQMTLIQKASITTIHSFCNEILRSNFNLAQIDPNFRIAETTENELIRLSALDEIMDEMYEDDEFGEDYESLVSNYSSVKTQKNLYSLVDSIYSFCMSLPNPRKWLMESCEMFKPGKYESFDETPWAEIIMTEFRKTINKILAKYDYMIQKADLDDGCDALKKQLEGEKAQFEQISDIKSYENARKALLNIVFERAKQVEKGSMPVYRKAVLDKRDSVKDDRKKLLEKIMNISGEEQLEVTQEMYPVMRTLSEVVLRFSARFDELKDKKNLLNFNDLEHKTLSILVDENGNPTPFAETIKSKYDEILIDEYQDTSRLQEAIFDAIKKENNLFMVGDLKQSIYRFRNTDPLLFKSKKESFSLNENETDRKIILSKNFRSRSHILDCINYIFTRIMSDSVGEIEYDEEEMLYFGAKDYTEKENLLTEVELIDTKEIKENQEDDEETAESVALEAYLVAKKIKNLINSKETIKSKTGDRNITYKDICILMRSTKDRAEIFVSVLTELGIPCFSDKSGSLMDSIEVEAIMSLLKVIDNPNQDIPMIAVLRSQIYAFTTDDLAKIRVKKRKIPFYEAMLLKAEDSDETAEKLKDFLSQLELFRQKAEVMNVAEFIWYVYMQTGFYDYQLTTLNGDLKQRNLRLLYIKAKEFEKIGAKGLYGFLRFLDEYSDAGGTYDAAKVIGEEHDVVRIMSIHKSKGLEFPVVFVCGLGKNFNKRDLSENVIFHSKLGYGPKFFDMLRGITYPNGARAAVKISINNELISEEMRILYVALTRAKERLILIGSANGLLSKLRKYSSVSGKKQKIDTFYTGEANSYMDWILMSLINHRDCNVLRDKTGDFITVLEDESRWSINIYDKACDLLDEMISDEALEDEEPIFYDFDDVFKSIAWEYPYKNDISIPSKVSVSELKRRVYQEEKDECVYLYPMPSANDVEKLSAAKKGTAVHLVMEKLDFKNVSSPKDIENKVLELKEKGMLSEDEAKAINVDKIFAFFDSEAGEIIRKAEKVEKEVMFAVNISAKELDESYTGDASVMLQGVIDCIAFIGDKMYIIDYKTDKVTSEEDIVKKYKIQLDSYEKAAKILYDKDAFEKMLYLFDKNKTLIIK